MTTPTAPTRRARGTGSVQWKNGRPYAVHRDILTGKRVWAGFDTAEECEAYLAQWNAERLAAKLAAQRAKDERAARRPAPRPSTSTADWTFGELLTDWEDRHIRGVQDSTMRDYGPTLNDLRAYLGAVRVRSLGSDHFEAYVRAKLNGLNTAGQPAGRKLKPITINRRLEMAKRVLTEAIKRGVCDGPNPIDEVVRPKVKPAEIRPLTEAELRQLISAASPQLRPLVRCYTELALRFSEAIGLPLNAYDREAKTLRIAQQIEEVRGGGIKIKPYTKTPWGIRTLRVSPELARELEAILDDQDDRHNPHGLFFTAQNGEPIRSSNWKRDKWRPLVRRAGLQKTGVTPHKCRHSRASLVASRHSELFAPKLQRFLGHHSVSFTLSRYGSHFSSGILEPAEYLTEIAEV